jgi:hypothetical protein
MNLVETSAVEQLQTNIWILVFFFLRVLDSLCE